MRWLGQVGGIKKTIFWWLWRQWIVFELFIKHCDNLLLFREKSDFDM